MVLFVDAFDVLYEGAEESVVLERFHELQAKAPGCLLFFNSDAWCANNFCSAFILDHGEYGATSKNKRRLPTDDAAIAEGFSPRDPNSRYSNPFGARATYREGGRIISKNPEQPDGKNRYLNSGIIAEVPILQANFFSEIVVNMCNKIKISLSHFAI